MRPFLPALGTLALLGGLLVGCGDDGDGTASNDAVGSESDEALGSESDDAVGSESDDAVGSESDDEVGSEPDDEVGSESAAFCARAEELEERFASLGANGPTPELFQEVSDAFSELAEDAPDEISADVEVLAAVLATFAEVFEDVDPADPESLAVLEEEAARLEEESARLEEAGSNVEAYFTDVCGIDLEDAPPGSGTAGDGSAVEQPDEAVDGEG